MDPNAAIKLRDTLKCGKNLPLRIFVNNAFAVIDESLTTQFTIWADEESMLYVYRLIGPQEDTYPNNRGKAISLYACNYEFIEGMEVCRLPLDDIATSLNMIEANGHSMSDEFKERVARSYKLILDDDRHTMSHAAINNETGSMLDTKDAWYGDKYQEAFKETLQERKHNLNVIKEVEEETGEEQKPYQDGINQLYK
jgi:hypothetical protein